MAARCSHWRLYAITLVMPISGYILATTAVRPSPYFGLFYRPQRALIPVIAHAALRVHLAPASMRRMRSLDSRCSPRFGALPFDPTRDWS